MGNHWKSWKSWENTAISLIFIKKNWKSWENTAILMFFIKKSWKSCGKQWFWQLCYKTAVFSQLLVILMKPGLSEVQLLLSLMHCGLSRISRPVAFSWHIKQPSDTIGMFEQQQLLNIRLWHSAKVTTTAKRWVLAGEVPYIYICVVCMLDRSNAYSNNREIK